MKLFECAVTEIDTMKMPCNIHTQQRLQLAVRVEDHPSSVSSLPGNQVSRVSSRINRETTVSCGIPEVNRHLQDLKDTLPVNKLFPGDSLTGDHENISRRVMRYVEGCDMNFLKVVFDELVTKIEISLPVTATKELSMTLHLNGNLNPDCLLRRYFV